MVVSELEKKIDFLKTDHDKGKEILHQLLMHKENDQSRTSYPEIQKLKEEI